MKLTILGSAAAECCPSLWCNCDNCRQAWKNGGKDIRRRTSYLIDNDTWVDFGPDSFYQTMSFFHECPKLKQLFFTHCHFDHTAPMEIYWRHRGFAANVEPVDMYAMPAVYDYMMRVIQANRKTGNLDLAELSITPHTVEPGKVQSAHEMEYMAIPANHGAPESVNFFFRRGGKTILIANDTGFWKEESWAMAENMKADLAVLDGTCALKYRDTRNGHMGCNVVVEFRDELLKRHIITGKTPVIVNHFSHNGISLHEELEKFFLPHGIMVGYDGLIQEI